MKKLFFVIAFLFSAVFYLSAQNNPIVQDIQSQVGKGTKINVFWVLPKNPKPALTKLLLYRNTRPITSYEQIKELKPIAELSPETTGYTDSVKDFNDYFYCVISYTNKACELVFISMNTTVNGVHLTPVVVTPPKVQKVEPEKLYEMISSGKHLFLILIMLKAWEMTIRFRMILLLLPVSFLQENTDRIRQ